MAGFTLAEAIIVILVLGVISAAIAVFIKGPVDAYFDVSRRAGLTDVADTALRRISRDLQRTAQQRACRWGLYRYDTLLPGVCSGGGGRALPRRTRPVRCR